MSILSDHFLLNGVMRKKTKQKLAFGVMVAGACFGIVCVILDLAFWCRIVTYLIIGLGVYYFLLYSLCPFCWKYSMRMKLFSKKTPTCIYCGREMKDEYKEGDLV